MQAEHQEHVRRPAADALHLRQRRGYLVVGQPIQCIEIERAVCDPFARDRADRRSSDGSCRRRGTERRSATRARGVRMAVGHQRGQTCVDGGCGFGRELLKRDRANERGEMIRTLRGSETAGAMAFDERGEDRIAAHQQAPCPGVIGWGHEDSIIPRGCRKGRSSEGDRRTSGLCAEETDGPTPRPAPSFFTLTLTAPNLRR